MLRSVRQRAIRHCVTVDGRHGLGSTSLGIVGACLAGLVVQAPSADADEAWHEVLVLGGFIDNLGRAVALDGNVLLLGAPDHDDERGIALLHEADTGELVAVLSVPETRWFGGTVALSDGHAIVGAPWEPSTNGAVYVADVASESLLLRIAPPPGMQTTYFGGCVAAAAGAVAVGTQQVTPAQVMGEAYVFDLRTGEQLLRLQASDGLVDDRFGNIVAIDGAWVAVSATGAVTHTGMRNGAVYVFDRHSGEEVVKIPCPTPNAFYSAFGACMDVRDGLLAVGDPYAWGGAELAGIIYVFDLGAQTLRHTLMETPPEASANLGMAVATDGSRVIGGAVDGNGFQRDSGTAVIFDLATGESLDELFGSEANKRSKFGYAVDIDGHRAVVGAYDNDPLSPESWRGAVYVFNTEPMGLHLILGGSCPGRMTITATNATPGGNVTFLASRTVDFNVTSGGPCAGAMLSVGRPYVGPTPRTLTADANGSLALSFNVPMEQCGRLFVQATDLSTCETSNVVRLE